MDSQGVLFLPTYVYSTSILDLIILPSRSNNNGEQRKEENVFLDYVDPPLDTFFDMISRDQDEALVAH